MLDCNMKKIQEDSIPKYIQVSIPFLYNKFLFDITKKRGWSILDFLIIKELNKRTLTHKEINELLNLNPRITLQVLLPMCDVGWISIEKGNNEFIFAISHRGKEVYESTKSKFELPYTESNYKSQREIFLDINGNYHNFYNTNNVLMPKAAYSNYKHRNDKQVIELKYEYSYVTIEAEAESLIKAATNEGEIIEGYTAIDSNYFSGFKYLIVDLELTERNGYKIIDNVLAQQLGSKLKNKVENVSFEQEVIEIDSKKAFKQKNPEYIIDRKNADLVYGGQDNKTKLLELIDESSTFLVIHSTFIRTGCVYNEKTKEFTDIFKSIKTALLRGVDVYILWGKTEREEDDSGFEKSRAEDLGIERTLKLFNTKLHEVGITEQVNFNSFTRTESHAKFVISDHATKGYCSMITSCNFFYTAFNTFETSAVIYDNQFTSKLLRIASSISTGRSVMMSDTSRELESLANMVMEQIERTKVLKGEDKLTIKLVKKQEHYDYISSAKNLATKRIYVVSDFISDIAHRPIFDNLAPLKIKQKFCYYKKTRHMSDAELEQKARDLSSLHYPIQLKKISGRSHKAKSHAKFIAWDDDDILLTSLNWLSANALEEKGGEYHELGLHIQGLNVAEELLNKFLPVAKN
ncbi:hypothetical protein A7325_12275 [Psychrobacter sp. SHUES1]|nr:hypothetical protein A7325_12275 [Psychrobacter sp. SHUES1]